MWSDALAVRSILRGVICAAAVAAVGSVPRSGMCQTDPLRSDILALLDTVRTASWVQTTWESLDGREETTSARCVWAGQDNMRLDVFDGRGKGATAILFEDRVYGFRRGLLSFVKRSFEPTHSRVLSLRGNTMRENGFLDDLRYLADSGLGAIVDSEEPTADITVRYTNADGLTSTIGLALNPIRVVWHEVSDDGTVVERYAYSDVRYNADIDRALLKP